MEVNHALDALTDTERQVVLLSVLGEMTNREVAKTLGIPTGSVCRRSVIRVSL